MEKISKAEGDINSQPSTTTSKLYKINTINLMHYMLWNNFRLTPIQKPKEIISQCLKGYEKKKDKFLIKMYYKFKLWKES